MYLRLDHHSGEPIYRQIVEQIKYMVACDRLREGSRLPSIRELARELKINPRTVVKAYEELRRAGLVVMRQGQGVFVAADRDQMPVSARKKAIEDLAKRMLAETSRMGAEPEEVFRIVEAVAEKMHGTRQPIGTKG